VKNHLLTNVHYNIYYREDSGEIHSWGTESAIQKTFKFDNNVLNENSGATVITQPISDGGRDAQLRSMEVDYAVTDYTDQSKTLWVTMRHSIRAPGIVGPEENFDVANGRRLVEYKIPANRPFFPTLVGRGHQFKFSGFHELRDIEVEFLRTIS
jgi:hypothetical protein